MIPGGWGGGGGCERTRERWCAPPHHPPKHTLTRAHSVQAPVCVTKRGQNIDAGGGERGRGGRHRGTEGGRFCCVSGPKPERGESGRNDVLTLFWSALFGADQICFAECLGGGKGGVCARRQSFPSRPRVGRGGGGGGGGRAAQQGRAANHKGEGAARARPLPTNACLVGLFVVGTARPKEGPAAAHRGLMGGVMERWLHPAKKTRGISGGSARGPQRGGGAGARGWEGGCCQAASRCPAARRRVNSIGWKLVSKAKRCGLVVVGG